MIKPTAPTTTLVSGDLMRAAATATWRKLIFLAGGGAVLVALMLLAAVLGSAGLNLEEVVAAVLGRVLPWLRFDVTPRVDAIVWDVRLPRVALAVIAGAGLAVAGAAMQGIMRNPLVSPFTMGISAAAGFGASVAIVLGAGMFGGQKYLVVGNAFVFALLAALLVFGLAGVRGMRPETLVLTGIAMNYFFSSGTSLLQYIATESEVHAVVHWFFGSLTGATWEKILLVGLVAAVCLPWLIRYAWDLNALVAGDDMAITLGVNPRRTRMICLLLATLTTASVISFTGIIGFVCLVAPHITRMLIGADHRFLLPGSALIGAILLLAADTLGRTAFQPTTIPVGIVVSVIGVPFFVYLIMKTRREYFQ